LASASPWGYRLSLTPAGKQILDRLEDCARRHEHRLDRAIDARHRAQFLRILQKIEREMS
jgi:DNA-binding MarR family transcriptional regulator